MKTVSVIVQISVKKNFNNDKMNDIYRQAAIKYLAGFIDDARKNPGCLYLDLLQDDNNVDELCLVEQWESKAVLDEHISSPYFQTVSSFLAEYAGLIQIRHMTKIY